MLSYVRIRNSYEESININSGVRMYHIALNLAAITIQLFYSTKFLEKKEFFAEPMKLN